MSVDARAAMAALDELLVALDEATKDGVAHGARETQTLIRAFAPHLSGELAESVTILGPSPTGAVQYTAKVGPTLVYGRIREIGGSIPGRKTVMTHPFLRWYWMGKPVFKRRVTQHGSRYTQKAVADVRARFQGICTSHWADAISSV